MATYDFDRFKDNGNTYMCKDTEGRNIVETTKNELNQEMENLTTQTNQKMNELTNSTNTKLEEFRKSLEDRYVIIGDSYLEGYTPDGNVESFGPKLQRMMNKSDKDWIMVYKGGTGFINTVSGEDYTTLTRKAHAKTTSPETITHVIYAGGYNDQGNSSESIQKAIKACYLVMHSLFPKAVMYLANIACNFKNENILWNLHDNVLHAYNYAGGEDKKITSLGYIGNCLHERGMMASDGYHPTDWGHGVIALALSYKLRGGEYEPVGKFIDFVSTYSQPNTSVSRTQGKEFFNKSTLSLVFHRIDFTTQPTIPTETVWIVGKVSDLKYVRYTYHYMASMITTAIVAYNGGANFRTVSMTIGVNEGGFLYVRLHTLNKEGTNYQVLSNIKFIAFDDATLRVPLCYI